MKILISQAIAGVTPGFLRGVNGICAFWNFT